MSNLNYLIVIALIQQGETRLMPIGGKSLKNSIPEGKSPNEEGEGISLELLLRIIERSDQGKLKRANGKTVFFY